MRWMSAIQKRAQGKPGVCCHGSGRLPPSTLKMAPIIMRKFSRQSGVRVVHDRGEVLRRSIEEVLLLREEMCRVLKFLGWKAEWWEDR